MKFEDKSSPLHRFFSGITEHAFHASLGVTDTQLVDYISDLLVRFVRADVIYRIRDLRGRQLAEVVAMMLEAEERIGEAQREAHRHIGDFILFWAGCYPEALPKMRSAATADYFVHYVQQGKRSYHIASTIPGDPQHQPSAPVLRRLSKQFDMCVFGLGEVRRQWQHHDDEDAPPFLIN